MLAIRALALIMSSTSASVASKPTTVNILDLAAAAVACTVTASRSIRNISAHHHDGTDQKNTRYKPDGSFVTDADFKAQGVIVQAIRSVSAHVRVVGEESEDEMAQHVEADFLDPNVLQKTRRELYLRITNDNDATCPMPLSMETTDATEIIFPDEYEVDASRVTLIVDPLDGTKSYAHGDYDCVSILIAIILDNKPCFGVVGKPFGYTGLAPIWNSGCVAIYGGPQCNDSVYVAGGGRVQVKPIESMDELPRAVISSSRSNGVVHDFCVFLGEKQLVYAEPMHISGAGEKSLRLILQRQNAALWFFPKAGTCLWDVAAPDALLRSLGGKMTDKFGNQMDYSKSREDAENVHGVVACIDAKLHATCIRLFREGDWDQRE
jgi:3'-phosphoadenosine 5'-phosphosulfate (PAPS) 3'-phosphatase